VDKAALLETARKHPRLTHVVSTFSTPKIDKQGVPIAEALVYDVQLQLELLRAGRFMEAMVLRVLGHARQARDVRHLTHAQRTYRLQNMHALLRELILPQLNSLDCMSAFASRSVKVSGITSGLFL